MTKINLGYLQCRCERRVDYTYYDSVNVTINSELKQKVLDRTINVFKCRDCGYRQEICPPFIYKDMKNDLFIEVRPEEDRGKPDVIDPEVKKLIEEYNIKRQVVYGYDELLKIIAEKE